MSYEIKVDYSQHRVNITMDVYESDTKQFFVDFKKAVAQAKGGGSHFDVLSDFSQMKTATPVMPKNIAEESAGMNSWSEANGMRKSASILTSTLFKMQLDRVTSSNIYAAFMNREEAEKWLNEG